MTVPHLREAHVAAPLSTAPASGYRRARLEAAVAAVTAGLLIGAAAVYATNAADSRPKLLLLALLGAFAVMLAGNPKRILIGAIILDVPLQWDFNLRYSESAAKLGTIGGIGISLTTLALLGLFGVAFLETTRRSQASPTRADVNRLIVPFALYVLVTVVSVAVAHNRLFGLFELIMLVQTLLFFVYLAHAVRTRSDLVFVAWMLVGSLLLESLIIIGERYAGLHFSVLGLSTDESANFQAGSRSGGTLGSPNAAGGFLALFVLPCITLATAGVSRTLKLAAATAAGLGTIALVLTFSRGAWFSFVLGLTLLLVAGLRRGWFSARVPIFVALLVLIVVVPFYGLITARLNGNDRGSAASRVPLMRLAGDMIKANPVLGVGANNFAQEIPKYAGPKFSRDWIYTVHNKLLLVWAESGFLALAAFLWFLGRTIRTGIARGRGADDLIAPLAIGLTAGFAGQIANMLVEPFHDRSEVQGLVLFAALIAALGTVAARSRAPAPGVRAVAPAAAPTGGRSSRRVATRSS
jgi:putative inorganic carbon (HCO3(-)) transporter